MRKLWFAVSATLFLLGVSCSETPQTAKKEPEKQLDPISGQSALFRMYSAARSWAPDAQPLNMHSIFLTEVPTVPPGKAAAWEALFVSAQKSQAKNWTYSIVDSPGNLHRGIFAGLEQGWSGPRGITTPFLMAAVKIDTDAAYKTALEHGGQDYDKKNPGKPISYLLEKNNKFPDPVWRVIWGESVGTSNFSVYVDASTGDFKEKMH